MESIEFVPGVVEGSVKSGVLFRFPDFSMSLIFTDRGVFAEILEEKGRRVFRGKVKDENIEEAAQEIMKKLGEVVRIYQNE